MKNKYKTMLDKMVLEVEKTGQLENFYEDFQALCEAYDEKQKPTVKKKSRKKK